jgi:hypothetical protein
MIARSDLRRISAPIASKVGSRPSNPEQCRNVAVLIGESSFEAGRSRISRRVGIGKGNNFSHFVY